MLAIFILRLSTAGHSAENDAKLHFGNVYFADSDAGSAIYFVIHPKEWGPFQHRFKTDSLTEAYHAAMSAMVAAGVTAGLTSAIAAAAASGAVIGSFIPVAGTAAGAVLGVAVVGLGAAIGTLTDDYIGDYLHYIG